MVENASACANGDFRSLTLSVEDDVRQLSGKRFGSIPSLERFEHDRWIDQYKNPGPFVCTPCARASSHSITQDGASTGRAGFVVGSDLLAMSCSARGDAFCARMRPIADPRHDAR